MEESQTKLLMDVADLVEAELLAELQFWLQGWRLFFGVFTRELSPGYSWIFLQLINTYGNLLLRGPRNQQNRHPAVGQAGLQATGTRTGLIIQKYHPDKNTDKEFSTIKFREISEAYSVLNDPQKRDK